MDWVLEHRLVNIVSIFDELPDVFRTGLLLVAKPKFAKCL